MHYLHVFSLPSLAVWIRTLLYNLAAAASSTSDYYNNCDPLHFLLVMAVVIIAVVVILLSCLDSETVAAGAQVPAMFVLGDSLLDPGNNNDLITLAKANYWPNGIDFPEGTTGRFCNGGTTADHLGYLLGLPLIPPFNNPKTIGSKILQGVNYASAAAGILENSGRIYGDLFSMNDQIKNFKLTLQELSSSMGNNLNDFLAKSLFFICIGNNDYINNYLLPLSDMPAKYTPEAFHQLLIQQYSIQLKELYEIGARKFVIAGLPTLGCIPNQIGFSNDTSSCLESVNELASVFNSKLKVMLSEHNLNLKGSYFLYWDIYAEAANIIHNISQYGFKYQHRACCGAGRAKGQVICLPLLPVECNNRSEFVFWDPYHPTDAFNVIISRQAYQGTLQSSFPMNVQQLVQM